MTVADGYVEGMIDGVVEPSTQRLGQVAEELRRMRRLADDLSLLSRAEEGRLGLHLAPLDLAVVAGAAAERLRPQAEDAGLDLEVDRPTDPLPLTEGRRPPRAGRDQPGGQRRAPPRPVAASRSPADGAARRPLTVSDTGEG
ncbi:MAG: hypothetical protein R2734_02455 [Nocardioides sp.]